MFCLPDTAVLRGRWLRVHARPLRHEHWYPRRLRAEQLLADGSVASLVEPTDAVVVEEHEPVPTPILGGEAFSSAAYSFESAAQVQWN